MQLMKSIEQHTSLKMPTKVVSACLLIFGSAVSEELASAPWAEEGFVGCPETGSTCEEHAACLVLLCMPSGHLHLEGSHAGSKCCEALLQDNAQMLC